MDVLDRVALLRRLPHGVGCMEEALWIRVSPARPGPAGGVAKVDDTRRQVRLLDRKLLSAWSEDVDFHADGLAWRKHRQSAVVDLLSPLRPVIQRRDDELFQLDREERKCSVVRDDDVGGALDRLPRTLL